MRSDLPVKNKAYIKRFKKKEGKLNFVSPLLQILELLGDAEPLKGLDLNTLCGSHLYTHKYLIIHQVALVLKSG